MSTPVKRCEASPGPILVEEEVAYGLYSPELFNPMTGKLTSEAVKVSDLREPHVDLCGYSTGLSVCRRLGAAPLEKIWEIPEQIAVRRETRRIEGYALVAIDQILKIKNEDERLVILDDGRIDYSNHAVIRGAPGLSRGALRGLKNDLLRLLNENVVRDRG